jgi:hypothetical protein
VLKRQKTSRQALAAIAAAAMVGTFVALAAPPASATGSQPVTASRDDAPNERAPRVPNAPDLGDAPWTSPEARDMVGYRLSTYTGKYYDKRFEQYRLCVVQRESGGRYGESSSAHIGAYQFSYSLAGQALRSMRPGSARRQADVHLEPFLAGHGLLDDLQRRGRLVSLVEPVGCQLEL